MTTRSYDTEEQAIAEAVQWCRERGLGRNPSAQVINKQADEASGDERDRLLPSEYRVSFNADGVLGILTWPPASREENDAHVLWALERAFPDDHETPPERPRPAPVWRRLDT